MSYRNMILVSAEEYQNLRKQLLYQTAPELTQNLYKIRDSTASLPIDQKMQLEGEVLRQHIDQNRNEQVKQETFVSNEVLDDHVILNNLKHFSKINNTRANQIYNHLKAYKMQWNVMGQMLDVDNKPIPNSNIVELIDYITNNKVKARLPAGFNEFINLVELSQLPRHYLSTKGVTRLSDYKQIQNDEENKTSILESEWKRILK